MSRMRAFRSVLASVVILVLLRAAPAYPWHGSGFVTALVVAPSNPNILYARTSDRGVFKSTDGGASWIATGGLTNFLVWTLAIDPSNPNILYAGTHFDGVFKSTDGGRSWIPSGLTNDMVQALAIDPVTPTTLYAGTIYAYKSTDGGATWSFSGLSDVVQALAIDPSNPNTLYAGTDINYGADPEMIRGGVFKSTDGGGSWSTTGLTNIPVSALAIAPSSPTTLYAVIGGYYAGLYKSTDGGVTWNWSAAGLRVLFGILAIDPQNENTVYAGTESGVFKSTDGAATWSAVNTGLTDTLRAFGVGPSVGPLAIDPVTPTTLYAGTEIGLFKSTHSGATWSPTGLIQHSPLQSVSLNPTSVTGGTPSTGTVTLITPAPAEGATAALSSNNTALATVPPSVTVPAGATSANFTVSTSPASGPVSIFATYDDAFRSAQLILIAPPSPP